MSAVDNRITVCGGLLAPGAPAVEAEYNGQTYTFCTRGCLRAFWSNPEDWLMSRTSARRPAQQ